MLINAARTHQLPKVFADKLLAHVFNVDFGGPRLSGFLFQASGASSIQHSALIQRYFRDAQALAQHALHAPTSALEVYGRFLVGLEPNSALL